ncbi:hypothetical protein Tco_0420640 [Tanacetum coccineum]
MSDKQSQKATLTESAIPVASTIGWGSAIIGGGGTVGSMVTCGALWWGGCDLGGVRDVEVECGGRTSLRVWSTDDWSVLGWRGGSVRQTLWDMLDTRRQYKQASLVSRVMRGQMGEVGVGGIGSFWAGGAVELRRISDRELVGGGGR